LVWAEPLLPQRLAITNPGDGPLNWTASTDVPWLILGRTSGTVPADAWRGVYVNVNQNGLPIGEYVGTITFDAPGAIGSPGQVRVTLRVYG
jgi:hypothetical protein